MYHFYPTRVHVVLLIKFVTNRAAHIVPLEKATTTYKWQILQANKWIPAAYEPYSSSTKALDKPKHVWMSSES